MRTMLKFIAGIIGAMILLIIIAVTCLMLFFHPNNLKTQLSKQVSSSTGRQLSIGDVSWTVFPWIGIKANDVSLSDAPSFDNKIFAQAKQAEIAAKLIPLLHGRLELGQLTVDGLNLNLVKNAKGVTNWQDLLNKTNASSASVDPDNEATPINIKKNFIVILSGITLKNSNLNWIDQQKNKKLTIQNLQLDVKSLSLNHPIPVSFSFDINSNDPKFIGSINMQSDVSFNQSQHSISFNDMKTTLTQSDNKYPNGNLAVSLNTDASLDLSRLVLSLSNLDANIANLHLQGNLQSDPLNNKNIGFQGSLKIPNFNVRDFLSAIGKASNSPIQTSSATFHLQASSSALSLKQLQVNIDNMHISGNLDVTNFSNPNYQFKLSADNINTNQFSSNKQSTANSTTSSTNNSGNANQSGLLPVALFKTLNANGDLSVNNLTLAKSTITNFYTHIAANNGVVRFNPLNGVIYQGQMHNNIAIDVRNVTPQYTIITNFTDIQMGPLLTELADITKIKISGSGNLSANITAAGNNNGAIKQTLSGNAKFSINNGILYGIDIPYYSDVADSLLNKQIPAGNNTHQTSFGNLTATANIKNGLVSNNDLLVQAPDINVTGKGTANLVNEQLDYAMKMQRMVNAAAKGPAIPLIIKGTFSHPSIQPDVTEIIKDQAVKQLEQQATKQLQKALGGSEDDQQLEKNVGEQLQKGLKSLFGQ